MRVGFLFLLVLSVSGCAFFGGGGSSDVVPSPFAVVPAGDPPSGPVAFQVFLVDADDLSATFTLSSDRILGEDVWVYLHISSGDNEGDVLEILAPAGSRGRDISFPRELFFLTPVTVRVFPCQDGCYTPAGESVSLFN